MIIAVALLVAFSAFFSSAETAVNSCSRPRLQNMLEKEQCVEQVDEDLH